MPRHAERRTLPQTSRQLFDLVCDIDRYPDFLPWCTAARVRRRDEEIILADMVIGFGLFREHFTSKALLAPDAVGGPRIDLEFVDGPFRHMHGQWLFHPLARGTDVAFNIDFELHSRLLQMTLEMLFHEAVRRMVGAFEERARKVYGS